VNAFLLLTRPSGSPVPDALRNQYAATPHRLGLQLRWFATSSASALVCTDDTELKPPAVLWGSRLGVGFVRLDNRAEVRSWDVECDAKVDDAAVSDLELVVRIVARTGPRCIPHLLGDFAFAVWDETTRNLVAARDAFGVRQLYWRERPDLLAIASRAELLADGDDYDRHTLLALAAACTPPAGRSVYAGVRALAPARVMLVRDRRVTTTPYWKPEDFAPAPDPVIDEEGYCATFRDLFSAAVHSRLTGHGDTWAQLSGGLDSSSVVSVAQWLARRGAVGQGVSGTISWVYRWSADSDERVYSDAVAAHAGVANRVLANDWFWAPDPEGPPHTDQPTAEYSMYARERRTCRLLRHAGAKVLLTGYGSDHYLIGNMFFFADWLVSGRARAACREMLHRAALGRVSFWNLAYQNALLPLLPPLVQRHLVAGTALPEWIDLSVARRFDLRSTADGSSYAAGRRGEKYRGLVLETVRGIPDGLDRHNVLEDTVDVRHPFLYRPLVELGLRLPATMCVRPHARKWILRQAMRGILPDIVRTRVGKGTNVGCALQSLGHERATLEHLLVDPVLAQLGCIDRAKLRLALDRAWATGAEHLVGAVSCTLAIESWLRARSDWHSAGEGGAQVPRASVARTTQHGRTRTLRAVGASEHAAHVAIRT
jgi:asparagine synthase (glutamine-hydrolysing)